jgi:hypothetical protein
MSAGTTADRPPCHRLLITVINTCRWFRLSHICGVRCVGCVDSFYYCAIVSVINCCTAVSLMPGCAGDIVPSAIITGAAGARCQLVAKHC